MHVAPRIVSAVFIGAVGLLAPVVAMVPSAFAGTPQTNLFVASYGPRDGDDDRGDGPVHETHYNGQYSEPTCGGSDVCKRVSGSSPSGGPLYRGGTEFEFND